MWTPDSELEDKTVSILERAVANHAPSDSEALTVLEAVGTLVALGRSAKALPRVAPELRKALEARLASIELPELDEAMIKVLDLAPSCLTLDPSLFEEELRPLLSALDCRDRVELLWIGAESLALGSAWSVEAQASRVAFDEGASEVLWQLLPLEARRWVEVEWMEPSLRTRFWWRIRGAELPAEALSNPSHWEAVLSLFPAARDHLEALAKVSPKPKARVLSLAEAIRRRRRPQTEQFRAAATAHQELILSADFVEVSLEEPDQLVVDLLTPLEGRKVPQLECEGRSVEGRASPTAQGRYRFSLSGLPEGKLVLRLPLATGARVVELN